MPTVIRSGPYRFYFYSGDHSEPPHIHVERDNDVAKFWLSPVRLQTSGGFSRSEIARLLSMVDEYKNELLPFPYFVSLRK